MLPSFCSDTITRVRPGEKTVRGQVVPDWNIPPATLLDITGCSVQPASTDLFQDGRVLGILDGMTCYMPPGADVQEGDRIEYDGAIYTIDGAPRKWISPGNLAHTQLRLVRWSG